MKNTDWKKPPWEVCNYSQCSMGWRMGGGETYISDWNDWFQQLDEREKAGYMAQYPEPEGWFVFYDLHLQPLTDKSFRLLIQRFQTFQKAYYEYHNHQAFVCEDAGLLEEAITHLEKIIACRFLICVDEKSYLYRYIRLKRQFAARMLEQGKPQLYWTECCQSTARQQLQIQHTVTADNYAALRQGVIVPVELVPFSQKRERTWIKYFVEDTLYIHPHWNAPCLFNVIFSRNSQGSYHLQEAWMNTEIPFPDTHRPAEDLLETFLARILESVQWEREFGEDMTFMQDSSI